MLVVFPLVGSLNSSLLYGWQTQRYPSEQVNQGFNGVEDGQSRRGGEQDRVRVGRRMDQALYLSMVASMAAWG